MKRNPRNLREGIARGTRIPKVTQIFVFDLDRPICSDTDNKRAPWIGLGGF